MSNYPPYQYQPYQPTGPYMPPQVYQPRPELQPPMQQPQPQAAQAQPGPVPCLSAASRPVTSKEEAMGVAADFSGALMLFPDITHNRVYVKRWDLGTGGPVFQEFSPAPGPVSPPAQDGGNQQKEIWASIQDLQNLQDVVNSLKKEIDRLKKTAGRMAEKNDAEK